MIQCKTSKEISGMGHSMKRKEDGHHRGSSPGQRERAVSQKIFVACIYRWYCLFDSFVQRIDQSETLSMIAKGMIDSSTDIHCQMECFRERTKKSEQKEVRV